MRILYLTQRFDMKNRGIQTDLLSALSEDGHKLTVAACVLKKNIPSVSDEGLEVIYAPIGDQFGVGAVKKGLIQFMIPFNMIRAVKKRLRGRTFDLILYATPPVTLAPVVKYCKKAFGCPSFLALKDIFPQNAVDLGMMSKGGPAYTIFRKLEKRLYAVSDWIGCMSEANIKYIKTHNPEIGAGKLLLFPNTIEPYRVGGDFSKAAFRQQYDLPQDKVVFLFGGNLGKPQAIDLLLRAIDTLKAYPKAYFLILGKGSEYERIDAFLREGRYPNARLIGFLPSEDYNRAILACDVGILLLRPEITVPNIPEKTLSYMANAIPILAATDAATDVGAIVENQARCGQWCASDDLDTFINRIQYFCEHPGERADMGRSGQTFFASQWHVSRSVAILNSLFGERTT